MRRLAGVAGVCLAVLASCTAARPPAGAVRPEAGPGVMEDRPPAGAAEMAPPENRGPVPQAPRAPSVTAGPAGANPGSDPLDRAPAVNPGAPTGDSGWPAYPGRPPVADAWIEHGLAQAAAGDWVGAGFSLRRARELYGEVPEGGRPGTLSREELDEEIRRCSTRLLYDGIREYRRGDLKAAVETWKRIEAFDPSFRDAQKNVETASEQLRNLERLVPPPNAPQ